MATNNSINSRELIKTNNLSDLTNAGTARTNLGLGSAAVVATDLADLNESTIEAAIDTLANLTSIQGRTITLADAGANAIFGWDDVAGAYENLTQAEARTVLGLGTAAYVATDLADLNEATIESAIDTLANLTSIQGRTVTLADAGANAVFGWDDVAGAYENLTAGEVRGAIGLATSDSPQFTGIELGHASDTTLARVSAGVVSIEGVTVATAATGTRNGSFITTQQSLASIVAATTGTACGVRIEGMFKVTVAGTIIPSLTLVTAVGTATVATGSYILLERVGSTSVVSVGQWS